MKRFRPEIEDTLDPDPATKVWRVYNSNTGLAPVWRLSNTSLTPAQDRRKCCVGIYTPSEDDCLSILPEKIVSTYFSKSTMEIFDFVVIGCFLG